MKKILSLSLILTLLLSAICVVPTSATSDITSKKSGDYYYNILDDGTAEIAEYQGNETKVSVPSEIDGYKVTHIGYKAFFACDAAEVILPDTITYIDKHAFQVMRNLENIHIPQSVKHIELGAFEHCFSLSNIALPNKLEFLGHNVLNNTSFSNNPDNWENGLLYSGNCLVASDQDFSGVCEVKNGTTIIANNALEGRAEITEIILPQGLKYIGDASFSGCKQVKSLTIPDGVLTIGEGAFYYCTALENINLPKSLTKVGTEAFRNTQFSENPDNRQDEVLYADGVLLETTPELTGEYIIKDGTYLIADRAFLGQTELKSIIIPDSVKYIGDIAFGWCSDLEKVHLSENLTEISRDAFIICTKLKDINIPSSVIKINEGAFKGCSALTSIDIPETVIEIGKFSLGYNDNADPDLLPNFILYGTKGSAAQKYAFENPGIDFRETLKYKEEVLGILNISAEGPDSRLKEYREIYKHHSEDSEGATATPDFVLIEVYEDTTTPTPVAEVYDDYVMRRQACLSPDAFGYVVYLPDEKEIYGFDYAYDVYKDEIQNLFAQGVLGELIGDVNYDKKLTIKDVTHIQKALAGLESIYNNEIGVYLSDTENAPRYIGDFNRDGKMNIRDATEIQKHLAGIDKNDPNSDNVETNPLPKPPAKITFDGKTYEAKVGDTITLSMELYCSEIFNSISTNINYDQHIITAAPLDKDTKAEWFKAHCPNLPPNNIKYYGYSIDVDDSGRIMLYPFDQDGMDFTEKKLVYSFDFLVVGSGEMTLDANLEGIRLQYDGALFENGKPVGDTVVDYSYSFKVN